VIFDGDIAFNSSEPWSMSGANNTIDIRAVALHEIGHMTGLSHSCIRDAVMWPFLSSDITSARTLKADDIAYASYYYPSEPAYSNTFGSIRGSVINGISSIPILGAHVFAVNPLNGQGLVGAYSGDDGSYVIPGLSAGNYLVAIEPLDGDPAGLDPFRINEVVNSTSDTDFPEEFYDANEANVEADPMAGLSVSVAAGSATAGINIVTNTLVVPGVSLVLNSGYNLFAYPVEAPSGLTAYQALQALGTPAEVNSIDRFVPTTGTFERAEFVNENPEGANFSLHRGEGYIVHMNTQKVIGFSGGTDCPALDLSRGMNLVGIPCPPAAYTAFNLLQDIGAAFEVQKIERFNPDSGMYETAWYDISGIATGINFPIKNGEGYIVHMLSDKNGVRIPAAGSSFAPVITSLSPGRGVPGTIVVISGEGFSPDVTKNTVTFNSIGAGVVFATSTTLTVTVPGNATTGPVRVIVNGRFSNAINFVVDTQTVPEDPAGNTEIIPGQTVDGNISAEGEQDRYTFIAPAGALVTVTAQSVTTGVPDLVLLLEDPYGIVVATDDNSGGGTNPAIRNFEIKSSGHFTIVVSNVPGSGTGPYKLSFNIQYRAAPTNITVIRGNYQTGLAGSVLPVPMEVFITGETGAPVSGMPVSFVATEVGVNGSSVNPQNAGTTIISTNASGIVTIESTLPNAAGFYTVTVITPGGRASNRIQVSSISQRIASVNFNCFGQGPAVGIVGQYLTNPFDPLKVTVLDIANNPVEYAMVFFDAVSGGGSVVQDLLPMTDANGEVKAKFKLGTSISDPQIVAAFVPGRTLPLLCEVKAKADIPDRVISNISNFDRITLGTAALNAIRINVYDRFGNPVEGANITYSTPADAPGIRIEPGLGPDGKFFTNPPKTNKDGLHVAMVSVLPSVIPTIDEFTSDSTPGLQSTYVISTAVTGGINTLYQVYFLDVDMGPHMVTASQQNDSALISQRLTNPVKKKVFRYERLDTNGSGDFRDDNFSRVVEKRIPNVRVYFSASREDGRSESTAVLQKTRPDSISADTDASGIATMGVTMGDVGGVNSLKGQIISIPVTWYYANGTVMLSDSFSSENLFAELTNLIAIPVIITLTFSDTGSGLDFATLNGTLNSFEFFNGLTPPLGSLPVFPEKMEVIIGGVSQNVLPQSVGNNIVTDSAFKKVELKYYPHAQRLATGTNTLIIKKIKDKIENQQDADTVQPFTFP
jgi:hypothetical protein